MLGGIGEGSDVRRGTVPSRTEPGERRGRTSGCWTAPPGPGLSPGRDPAPGLRVVASTRGQPVAREGYPDGSIRGGKAFGTSDHRSDTGAGGRHGRLRGGAGRGGAGRLSRRSTVTVRKKIRAEHCCPVPAPPCPAPAPLACSTKIMGQMGRPGACPAPFRIARAGTFAFYLPRLPRPLQGHGAGGQVEGVLYQREPLITCRYDSV